MNVLYGDVESEYRDYRFSIMRGPLPFKVHLLHITTAAINEEHALKIDQSHSSSSSAAGGWAQTGAPADVATA